jgi:beta-barrel assembly-enhancing protease
MQVAPDVRRLGRMSLRVIVLTATLAVASYAARRPGDPFRPGMNLFSKQQDIQLGQEASQEVRKQYPLYRNDWVQQYVRRVGDRLAATGPARESGFPFTFTVLQNKQVNAFALPGGPMYIFTGLLQTVDNEAQLAAVMAHEMSHVILRHGTHEASKAKMVEIPALLAGEALGSRSLLTRLTEMGANSFILKFSRDAESDADALGAHLMAEAGYDPIEMSRFFGKLQAAGGQGNSRIARFLSDHPNPGNRERLIEEEAQTLPRRQYGFETGGFVRMKSDVGRR